MITFEPKKILWFKTSGHKMRFQKIVAKSAQQQGFIILVLCLQSVGLQSKIIPQAVEGNFEGRIERIEFPSKAHRQAHRWCMAAGNNLPGTGLTKLFICRMDKCFLMRVKLGINRNGRQTKPLEIDGCRQHASLLIIVVGIWNAGPDRHAEYMQKGLRVMSFNF